MHISIAMHVTAACHAGSSPGQVGSSEHNDAAGPMSGGEGSLARGEFGQVDKKLRVVLNTPSFADDSA